METKNRNYSFLLFFIIFLTSFGLGMLTSQKLDLKMLLNSQETNSGVNLTSTLGDALLKKDLNLDLFWKVYNIVGLKYYSSDSIDTTKSQYGLISGYVNSLGDKFSEFMPPEETKQFNTALSGDFEGIGAVIDKNESGIVIDRVLKGSPALNSGLQKGDVILQANGKDLSDLSVTDAVSNIKGPAGSTVKLKIARAGEKDYIYKDIIRQKITIPSVDTKSVDDEEIGYIALNIFGENTAKEFSDILNTFRNDKVKGIIIDLRDNGGGLLEIAREILSNFIENDKVVVTTKYKDATQNEQFKSMNDGTIFGKKIVVLINENSASASEITAGALRDYNKAILVGTKSYGKGSVQQPFSFPDGSMLKLTIAKWYTPNDVSIDHNGINPDVEVKFEKKDYTPEAGKEKDFVPYDRQLEVAKQVLKDFIKLDNISLVVDKYNKNKTGSGTVTQSGASNSTGTTN